MRYLCLIYGNEAMEPEVGSPAAMERYAAHMAFGEAAGAAGVLRGGEWLKLSSTATSLRPNGGSPHVTDGPFAETKEQLGGYYVIETDNLDSALEWAAKIPTNGGIEVRPLNEM